MPRSSTTSTRRTWKRTRNKRMLTFRRGTKRYEGGAWRHLLVLYPPRGKKNEGKKNDFFERGVGDSAKVCIFAVTEMKHAFMDGEIPKWPTGADCNSADFRLRRFESCSPHRAKRRGCLEMKRQLLFLFPFPHGAEGRARVTFLFPYQPGTVCRPTGVYSLPHSGYCS